MIKNLISLVGIIILFATLFTLLVYIWLLNSTTIFERRESPAPPPQQPAKSFFLPTDHKDLQMALGLSSTFR